MNKEIKGVIPIAAAPFTKNGYLDEDSFQQMIRHLLQAGIHGVTLFGMATEFYKLTDKERGRMLRLLLDETNNYPSVASMISVTDHTAENAISHAQQAERMGADSLMLLPPFFLQPSAHAITEHIRKVADSVDIPVIVQYAPLQTNVRIPPEVFLTLHEKVPNIQFIKVETQPPGRYITSLMDHSQGKLGALVGYAGVQMPDVLERRAVGIQPGCSFIELYVQLYQLFQSGEKKGFHTLFQKLLPYISYWMQGIELIIKAEKVILYKRGIIASDYCRSPQYTLDNIEMKMIDRFLEQFADELRNEGRL
ncbi:dihydrodipicolinate synthase family protein [Salibacterium aidingense]|uniref:dihydrodipicolinate synthase family protein n=1 Tax=Salibacterium aidingense TaxID=384933 RepID=UPI003BC787FD